MNSFRDPVTHILKAFGYCDTNSPGDLVQEELDSFSLEPGKWQLVGETWIPAQPTVDDLIAANTAEIQGELDRQAKANGYDSIVSACSYAAQAAGAPFQAEGAAFLAWRSDVWMHGYSMLAEVKAGTRAMPTPKDAVAMMPPLVLP